MNFWEKVKKILIGDPPVLSKEVDLTSSPFSGLNKPSTERDPSGKYKRVRIERGGRGWGGPLIVSPTEDRNLIYCVTGGGIHPIAQHIANLTGGVPFDGFRSKADFSKIAVAVIDCGGTARVGVYPMKGVLTVDVHGASPSGPLMKYITADLFVSGVKENNIIPIDE
jgi:glucitol/sorbitol PTS system EIIB component